MKYLGTFIQYVTLIFLGAVIYVAIHNNWLGRIPHYDLTVAEVLALGFVFAFTFTKARYWAVKPFSCLGCMTGWLTLSLAIYSFGWIGLVFLPIGYTIGAIADRIITRFL